MSRGKITSRPTRTKHKLHVRLTQEEREILDNLKARYAFDRDSDAVRWILHTHPKAMKPINQE